MNPLQSALDAVNNGDMDEAIRQLVQFWRESPVVAVGDFVAELDRKRRPEIIADSDEWTVAAKAPTVDNLGVLARSILVKPRAKAHERLGTVIAERWGPDPRLGAALAGVLSPVMRTATSSRSTWKRVFDVIDRCADPRFLQMPDFDVREDQRIWLEKNARTEPTRKRFPAGAPELTAEQVGLFEQLQKAVAPSASEARGEQTLEGLLEAVYAAPEDDGPRLVLADWLTSRGDPRGEFMNCGAVA